MAAAPLAPDTWTPLAGLPDHQTSPVFALAVSPDQPQTVLVGTAGGSIYRSTDAGATWSPVKSGLGEGVLSLAFDPFQAGVALAGARHAGLWRSSDMGQTWAPEPGTGGRTVRALGFARSVTVAGTDQGLLLNRGGGWSGPGSLAQVAVSAVAVPAVNDPVRLIVGGDASAGGEPLPVFSSSDGGQNWSALPGTVGGSNMVSAMAAGPLPADQAVRPLLMGTNAGLFGSVDNGSTWQPVTGAGSLPATDFSAVAFVPANSQRYYAASDGGGSKQGGLWSTADGGAHFAGLQPPVEPVTALAVSAEDQPVLYTATFRPIDHAVMLWAYRDTGGPPKQPAAGVPAPRTGAAGPTAPAAPATVRSRDLILAMAQGPEAPWIALGGIAVVVLFLALLAYARRTRGL